MSLDAGDHAVLTSSLRGPPTADGIVSQDLNVCELSLQGVYDAVGDKIREVFRDAFVGIRIYDAKTDVIEYPYTFYDGKRHDVAPGPLGEHGFGAHVIRTGGVWLERLVRPRLLVALPVCGLIISGLAIALAVSEVPRRRRGALEVHVQIDDPEFCLALQARRLGQPPSARLDLNFFSAHELAARTLLARQPPPTVPDRAPLFMIIGASWFGLALAVELARHWRLLDPHRERPMELVLVDREAGAAVTRLHRRYPFLATVCRFTSHERDIGNLLDGDLPDEPPDRVYLCADDEEAALKLALTMDHFWHRGPRSLVVDLKGA